MGCFSINFTFQLYFNRNLSWGLISKIINVSVVMIYERARGSVVREGFSGAIFSVKSETPSRSGVEAWLVRRCSLSGNRMG